MAVAVVSAWSGLPRWACHTRTAIRGVPGGAGGGQHLGAGRKEGRKWRFGGSWAAQLGRLLGGSHLPPSSRPTAFPTPITPVSGAPCVDAPAASAPLPTARADEQFRGQVYRNGPWGRRGPGARWGGRPRAVLRPLCTTNRFPRRGGGCPHACAGIPPQALGTSLGVRQQRVRGELSTHFIKMHQSLPRLRCGMWVVGRPPHLEHQDQPSALHPHPHS